MLPGRSRTRGRRLGNSLQYSLFGTLYGMWWDENLTGNHVTLPIDGESGMIFEATVQNTASKVIVDASDSNGGTYFGYFLDGGSGNTQATSGAPAYYVDGVLVASDQNDLHDALSDGLPHALRVTGLNLSDEDWTQMILGGYGVGFIPEGTFRDVVLRKSDETIVGSWSGYGNTNADWADKGGTGNFGMWFDGVNDEVCVGNSAAFNYTTDLDFTVTFVCSDPSVAQTLIAKGNGSTETCWAVDLSGGLLRFFGYTSGSVVKGILSGGPTIVANTLYTARFTFDGTTWKIFVDGVEAVSTSSAGTIRTNTEDVCVGSRSGVYRFFDGTLRDVVVKIDGALVGTWNGYGNTNADWEDQVGSNDGTVSGSPSRAVSTATGWRKESHGTVVGSPSRAISTDGGATWAMETASDADAAAYVTRLLNTGTSITPAQISALDTFFLTGKSEGWYSALKRMYLPIWGAAAPNAIDMIGGTSGTFNGSITHGAGFVTGDGSSSYFDSGATPSAMGISTGDAFILRGIHASPATASVTQTASCGVAASSATASLGMLNGATGHVLAGTTYFRQPSTSGGPIITGQGTDYRGIYIGSSTATDSRFLLRRRSGGTTVVSSTVSDTQSIYNGNPYFLSRNVSGSADYHTTQSEFAWALGTGMTQAQAGDFTTALETMWETCTGLTLF